MTNKKIGAAASRRSFLGLAADAGTSMHPSSRPRSAATSNSLRQIRNATMRLDYAGSRFLLDPMFAVPGSHPGFPGSAMSHLRNPLVPLPLPAADLVDVDAVIVTHDHLDHWDDAARDALHKDLPVFVQDDRDKATVRRQSFSNVHVFDDVVFRGVSLTRTRGQHGTDEVIRAIPALTPSSGVVLKHPAHPTVYIAGDTIWHPHVAEAIKIHQPDVIVVAAGFAQWVDLGPLLMGTQDVLQVHRAAPEALIVATHMEAMNPCILSRNDLLAFAEREGFAHRLVAPRDGELLTIREHVPAPVGG